MEGGWSRWGGRGVDLDGRSFYPGSGIDEGFLGELGSGR